jgi:hypothetical protein
MLLVNGYTGKLAQKLGLAPPGGRLYWPQSIAYPARLLSDLNLCYIHPCTRAFSSAKSRFHAGYEFASQNEPRLLNHVMVTGNDLKIIAHSQGVAFAEGIAAYLYEEKNIQASLLIALNGEQMSKTPQSRCAIATRISFRTEGDMVTNKFDENLKIRSLSIVEKKTPTGFIKYSFYKTVNEEAEDSALYFRGSYNVMSAHIAHRTRPNFIWRAVRHGLLMLQADAEEEGENFRPKSSTIARRQPFSQN